MSTRRELLESVADTISDYREGEVARRTPELIEKWLNQFPDAVQDPFLGEINHLLSKTYLSRETVTEFLQGLLTNEKFCGSDPRSFWSDANLLRLPQRGNSQRELLSMFDTLLESELGLKPEQCGNGKSVFVYLDDGVFGGGTLRDDIFTWLETDAPEEFELRIVVAVLHSGGSWFAIKSKGGIEDKARELGKKISVTPWRIYTVESRLYSKDNSDVLWPTAVPSGELAKKYVKYLAEEDPKRPPALRSPGTVGPGGFYSSDSSRILLEQELLTAGLKIRDIAENLPETARPLGATLLKTFGLGATFVTFRNCPNNCPLAFWVDDPWFPLFPRSSNSEAFMRRLMAVSRNRKSLGG